MTTPSTDQPYLIAVVGAGPSGIYAAEALTQQTEVDVQVVVIDKLPVPFGLVRYGVAPDHPSIRSIRTTLERTLDRPNVSFFGDVAIGCDLTVAELTDHVDACIYAFGAGTSRRLGIPGEDAAGSITAPDLVSWYTGNPDSHVRRPTHPPADRAEAPRSLTPAELLNGLASAVVVGGGNVALDVARILAKDAAELATTDMADDVLTALRGKAVTDVHLLARRGPGQTTMTTKEVRELGRIDDCAVVVHPADLDWPAERELATGRIAQRNLAEFENFAADTAAGTTTCRRRIHLHFWTAPVEILTREGRVGAVAVTDTRPGADRTGVLDAGLVVRAIGYRGIALDGLPFDQATGRVPHDEGRVLTPAGEQVPGAYVTGWIKRGPTGVIGTNKSDAVETVHSLLHDLDDGELAPSHPTGLAELTTLLADRGVTPLDLPAWHRIDAAEVDHGRDAGRERVTLAHREELLAAAREPPEGGS